MTEEVNNVGYGYADDTPQQSAFKFGLNPAIGRLIKFEWINNAGKDGAEGEALDIQFSVEGSERPANIRMFPVTKAFAKDGSEVVDMKAPEFQKAVREFNGNVSHILHCFNDAEAIKLAFNGPEVNIANFKDFCRIAMSLIPKNANTIPLDLFFQWEWQIKGEAKQTYLRLPNKITFGKWVCPAVEPKAGENGEPAAWKEWKHPSPDSSTPIALKYSDGAGNIHPFTRNGWFMLSAYATQQKEDGGIPQDNIVPEAPAGDPKASTW